MLFDRHRHPMVGLEVGSQILAARAPPGDSVGDFGTARRWRESGGRSVQDRRKRGAQVNDFVFEFVDAGGVGRDA